jgi:hypothetical protein
MTKISHRGYRDLLPGWRYKKACLAVTLGFQDMAFERKNNVFAAKRG